MTIYKFKTDYYYNVGKHNFIVPKNTLMVKVENHSSAWSIVDERLREQWKEAVPADTDAAKTGYMYSIYPYLVFVKEIDANDLVDMLNI